MSFLLYVSEAIMTKYLYITGGPVLFLVLCPILFYRRIVKPVNATDNGMELLEKQDFSSYLGHVGQRGVDRVVNVLNHIMD